MAEKTIAVGTLAETGARGSRGAWAVLLGSAVLEAVWATALGYSDGFTRMLPTVTFLATAALSMLGLGLAVKRIPLGTAYAVWVGIGAALTVGWAMATGVEAANPLKLLFIAGIVACAAGLKSLPAGKAAPDRSAPSQLLQNGRTPQPQQARKHADS